MVVVVERDHQHITKRLHGTLLKERKRPSIHSKETLQGTLQKVSKWPTIHYKKMLNATPEREREREGEKEREREREQHCSIQTIIEKTRFIQRERFGIQQSGNYQNCNESSFINKL